MQQQESNSGFYSPSIHALGSSIRLFAQFATKYGYLIVFSIVYGFSDGVFIASQCFILLSCVDAKRTTASFCINNVLYSFTAAAGGPIAGELGPIPFI